MPDPHMDTQASNAPVTGTLGTPNPPACHWALDTGSWFGIWCSQGPGQVGVLVLLSVHMGPVTPESHMAWVP